MLVGSADEEYFEDADESNKWEKSAKDIFNKIIQPNSAKAFVKDYLEGERRLLESPRHVLFARYSTHL